MRCLPTPHTNTEPSPSLLCLLRLPAGHARLPCRVHVLTDGRDVPDGSSLRFISELEAVLAELAEAGCDGKIASGGGRMGVTMDRCEWLGS